MLGLPGPMHLVQCPPLPVSAEWLIDYLAFGAALQIWARTDRDPDSTAINHTSLASLLTVVCDSLAARILRLITAGQACPVFPPYYFCHTYNSLLSLSDTKQQRPHALLAPPTSAISLSWRAAVARRPRSVYRATAFWRSAIASCG